MKPVPEMRTITSCLETPSTMTAWYCFASSDDTGGTSSGSKSIELRLSKGWLVQLARVFLELARGLVKLVRIKDGRWRQESKPEDAYPQTGALLGGGWAVCLNPFVALRGRRDGQTGPTDGSPPLGGKCGTGGHRGTTPSIISDSVACFNTLGTHLDLPVVVDLSIRAN